MTGFSAGGIAIAICDRCHFKYPYPSLRADGNSPALRVCARCWDHKDPWRLPARKTEAITMRYPRPDTPLNPPAGYIINNNGQYISTTEGDVISESP